MSIDVGTHRARHCTAGDRSAIARTAFLEPRYRPSSAAAGNILLVRSAPTTADPVATSDQINHISTATAGTSVSVMQLTEPGTASSIPPIDTGNDAGVLGMLAAHLGS
jgi:hypothetical protein